MNESKVRLKDNEINAIKRSLEKFFFFKDSVAYIYGSRSDLTGKGGDIDLLIVISDKCLLKNVLKTILSFEVDIINQIGDQKIDTKVVSKEDFDNKKNAFIETIRKSLIKIWECYGK